jgi:hypothetical protein
MSSMKDLLAAEWLKLWSLRSMRWAFAVSALLLIAANANAAIADYQNWPHYDATIRAHFIPGGAYAEAFTHNAALIAMLLTGSIGAIAIVSEYSTGQIRTTFAAVPARRSLLAAKAAVLTAIMLGFGAVVVAVSFGVTQAILSGRHVGISITYPGVLGGLVPSVLLPALSALVGMGLGALIRHSAATTVSTAALLLLVPSFFSQDRRWTADLQNAMPVNAWQRLRELPGFAPHDLPYPPTVTGCWLVYALWPAVAVLLALAVVHRRDV